MGNLDKQYCKWLTTNRYSMNRTNVHQICIFHVFLIIYDVLCTIYEIYLSTEIDYLWHISFVWKGPLVFGWNKTNRNSNKIHCVSEQKQRGFFRLYSFKVKQHITEAKQKRNKAKKVKQNEAKMSMTVSTSLSASVSMPLPWGLLDTSTL